MRGDAVGWGYVLCVYVRFPGSLGPLPLTNAPPLLLTAPAVDTQAEQRSMPLTIPFMAASTVELIRSLNMTGISKPDLLG